MSDLPDGWEWKQVGEIADLSLGKMLDKKQATGRHPTPYLRNVNVRWGSFDLADVASMDIEPHELDRVLVRAGDVVACEGGEPGRAAVWRRSEPMAIQKALHRIRPSPEVMAEYLAYHLQNLAETGLLSRYFTGTTIKHLPKEKLSALPIPLPPIDEQKQIVAAIEEHFSDLDSAEASLKRAVRNAARLRRSIEHLTHDSRFAMRTLVEVTSNFDGQRVPVKAIDRSIRQGPYPYYGASGIIDTVDEFLFDGRFLLVAEDGANLLSRTKPIAFEASGRFWVNNHAHVVQTSDELRLRFLMHYLNALDISRYITGTAQPKLTQRNMNKIEVAVPPLADQDVVIDRVERGLETVERIREGLRDGLSRSRLMRAAVLSAAFAGELSGRRTR